MYNKDLVRLIKYFFQRQLLIKGIGESAVTYLEQERKSPERAPRWESCFQGFYFFRRGIRTRIPVTYLGLVFLLLTQEVQRVIGHIPRIDAAVVCIYIIPTNRSGMTVAASIVYRIIGFQYIVGMAISTGLLIHVL